MAADNSANYILLTRLADEFAARYRAGQRPPLQEYIDRYPELRTDLSAWYAGDGLAGAADAGWEALKPCRRHAFPPFRTA